MRTTVHRITVLVVDLDHLGADEVKAVIESTRYPNHCIAPDVLTVESVEVEWSDEHVLNQRGVKVEVVDRVFAEGRV
jgi:hypothetical protein